MRHMRAAVVAVVMSLAGAFLLPGAASAQVILQQRCTIDSLYTPQAEARVEWMRQCALFKGTSGPSDPEGDSLWDYMEMSPDSWSGMNMYTGSISGGWVNASYVTMLYLSAGTSQSIDEYGFYKWSRAASRKRPRPYYPTYGNQYDINSPSNLQLFPHPTLANCSLYYDRGGMQLATGNFYVNGYCEAAAPPSLTNGVPVGVSGAAGSEQYYMMNVPAGATHVLFEMSGGTGDVDLYVRYGALPDTVTHDCRSTLGGNYDGCNMRSPAAGTWYIMLKGFSAYSGVSLKGMVYNRMTDGVATPTASGAQGSEQYWSLEVPAGMSRLNFTLAGVAGHTGDADLYVRYGVGPSLTAFDCRPYIGGSSEQCSFNAPAAGTWYVMVRGWSAYTGVTVTGDYFMLTKPVGPVIEPRR